MIKKTMKLIISIVLCQAAGAAGSFFTMRSVDTWYAGINKPFFNPPDWIFAPVWTLLFILMGISFYLVWINKKRDWTAINMFGIQLALNMMWSMIFFGLRQPTYALIEIVFLWAAIMATIIKFHKISRVAAYLLIPYILWVSFAIILNISIVILN